VGYLKFITVTLDDPLDANLLTENLEPFPILAKEALFAKIVKRSVVPPKPVTPHDPEHYRYRERRMHRNSHRAQVNVIAYVSDEKHQAHSHEIASLAHKNISGFVHDVSLLGGAV
jgi:hypothetical protein